MGFLAAAAFPVLPGQSERVRKFGEELQPNIDEFERLNKETTFTRFQVHLQEGPEGDLAIFVFEIEDPSKARSSFTDSAYDNWWLDYLRDVFGVDLRAMPEVPDAPPPTFVWPPP
ncbi:MAG: hypothetical protein M3280_05475 [Actinomycetota bacterium]|nr:hypothetical protein [Actinomycetota bacterium]